MITPSPAPTALASLSGRRPRRFLAELEGRSPVGFIGPNWYAAVMGTGIVAIALVGLPFAVPGAEVQRAVATGFWLLASALLVVITGATAAHHRSHPDVARAHLGDPVLAHFYGAPAMGLMTVGAATVLVGADVIGLPAAVLIDAVLWSLGTLLGIGTAIGVPLLAITRHDLDDTSPFGGWLMPIVPPMVSAATGALLVPHLPAGQARETLLLACYALFGLTLIASLLVIAQLWRRLVRHGVGAPAAVPTLWIVLGPLGQSITAVHHLGALAPGVLPAPYGQGFAAFALVFGVPMWGFAMLWLVLAATITLRTAGEHLPFTLTWWSFTFPVGTVVTGTSALAALTGLVVLQVAAGGLFLLLLGAWVLVAARSLHGVYVGRLLLPTR